MINRIARLLMLFVLGLTGVRAAETVREISLPPERATRAEVGRYLTALRSAVSPRTSDDRGEALVLSTATAEAAVKALRALPWEHIDLLLAECLRAESDVGPQARNVSFIMGRTELEFDMSTIALSKRTAFTRLVFYHLVHATDIPPVARKPLFEKWRELPELVAAVFKRSWYAEGDAYVSRALVKKLEEDVGWRGVAPVWSRYLAKLDTPRAWEALEYMLTGTSGRTLVDAYEAVKDLPAPRRDLDAMVEKGWQRYKWGRTGLKHPTPYARIAAPRGIAEAVVVLAESVVDPEMKDSAARDGSVLRAVLVQEFADERAAAEFVLKNAKVLRFDRAQRKYVTAKKS